MIIKKYHNQSPISKFKIAFILLLMGSASSILTKVYATPLPLLNTKTITQKGPCDSILFEKDSDDLPLQKNPWLFLHSYEASYDVESDGDKLGTAKRQLIESKGVWKLSMSTSLKKWLLSLKSEEYTEFSIQNDQLITHKFYTTSKVSFKKPKTISQSFNWLTKLETGKKNDDDWQLPLNDLLYDRMSHLLMLRADLLHNKNNFNYLVSYKGKHQTYDYVSAGTEKIKTSFGEFDALRLDRQKGDDSSFSVWLSPELNYFPIKIAQFEQDKPDIVLILNNLKYH